MLIEIEKLKNVFSNNGLELSEESYEKFNKFTDYLVEKKKV